jgi:hypothetical protein
MAHSLPDLGRKLQQDFAEAAVDLDLDLAPAAAIPEEEVRSIGIMAKRGAPNAIVQLDLAPAPVAGDSDQAIQDLLRTWEQLLPEELETKFRDCALDPYVAVGEWVVRVDQEQIRHWRAGDWHAKALAERPPLDQRRIELSHFHIVYAGAARAIVTYHVRESYPGSAKIFSGNAGAILVHVADGWRIASYTKAEQVGL